MSRLLDQLAAIARIRGERAEATSFATTPTTLYVEAAALLKTRDIQSHDDIQRLFTSPPPGTDPNVLRTLQTVADGDAASLIGASAADLPRGLRQLYESGTVTLDQLAVIHSALDAATVADLTAAIGQNTLSGLPGFNQSVQSAIEQALPSLRAREPRIPLGRAVAITEPVLERLREFAGVEWAEPVGALRRGQDMIGDIELVVPAADPQPVLDEVAGMATVSRQLLRSARRLYVVSDGLEIGIRCPAPETAGAVLLNLTGSTAHIDGLSLLAAARGWSLQPDGLHRDDLHPNEGAAPIAASEREVYAALGLAFIVPELREGVGEIDAAADGTLPNLVEVPDIRGDLHMHTDWSDGRDSIDAMIGAAAALGYQYIAITDHSEHSAASRSLHPADVARQADAIAAARERHPEIIVLHGCEVDILPNGTLDFPDALLQQFDIVLASLHDRAGHGPDKLLRRYARAMRHPLVTIITHPTNRLVPHRAGYDLDWEAVFAVAVETGTVLEIDGAPSHLDMDGALARRAIAAGVSVSIDSDCHRADLLGRQMKLGVTMARRGWVEPRHVINTQPITGIRSLITAKRSR